MEWVTVCEIEMKNKREHESITMLCENKPLKAAVSVVTQVVIWLMIGSLKVTGL